MPVRLKLLLPGASILAAALAIAFWPMAGPQWRSAWLIAGAVALLACQLLLNERWVVAALRAAQGALAGRVAGRGVAREWQDVSARIAMLQMASTRERSALERARSQAREIEAELQTIEQRYLTAVRGAGDGLWEWDLGTSRMLLSPRWQHMFGLDGAAAAMPVERWRERLHPQDRLEALDALEAHLRGLTGSYEHAHRMVHEDGSYRWVLSRATALRRASGTVHRVIGLDTDVTRLKRAETIIDAIAQGTTDRSGEAFFQALVQNFARALHVRCAFVTECTGRPPSRARTLAFWRGDKFDPNFEYELAGTPCEQVLRKGDIVLHREQLGDLYPAEAAHESYLGLPIRGRDGAMLGHLAFLGDAPMSDDTLVESVFRIFTARAAVEIELGHALRRLTGVGHASPTEEAMGQTR